MSDENADLVDLLGDPWTERADPRGRKRHRRTPQLAEKVSVLRASGLGPEQIAARVFLSEPTLRKYYFRELDDGAAMAQAVLTEAMWKKAREGNVSAARYIRETFGKGEALDAETRVGRRAARAPVVGKKAERQAAAEKVGGRFTTPAPPTLIN